MPNGTYGGVRGKETKVGQKTFVSRPTRFVHTLWCALNGAKRNGTAVALGVCGQKLSDETVAKVNSLTILLARLS